MQQTRIDLGKPTFIGSTLTERRFSIILWNRRQQPMLEFGAGKGELSKMLSVVFQLKACEVTKYPDALIPMDIYDGVKLPYKNNTFGTVVSFGVIEHVHSEDHSLKEIHRVMQPNGELIMSFPNKWWLFEVHYPFPFNRIPFLSWFPPIKRLMRARQYTKKQAIALLELNGFTVTKTEYMTAPMDVAPMFKRMFASDTTAIPLRATELIVYARKRTT